MTLCMVGLTSHFNQLISHGTTNDDLAVPDRLLVSTGRVFSALRGIVTANHKVLIISLIKF
jgi:hypothetical protein